MGNFRKKARKWIGRLAAAVLFLGLLLVFEGVFEDLASRLGDPIPTSRTALGVTFGDSPVAEMRWLGIDEVRPGGAAAEAGIRPGDGIKFDRFLGERFTWQPGETAVVTVDRDGHRFHATLTAQAPPERSANDGIPLFGWLILLLEPLMAGFVALLLYRGLHNRAAALLGVSMLFWLDIGLRLLPNWTVAPLTLFVGLPVRAAALYCWPVFAMEISGGTASIRLNRLVPRAGVTLAVAFFAFQLASILRVPFPAAPEYFFLGTYLVNLALGLSIIGLNYQRNDPAGRNRIKIVLAAFGILFIGIVTAIALSEFGRFEDAWGWMLAICLSTALGLLGYATLNKQLFDFGFAINRTLVFGGVTFTLLAMFGLLEWSVEHFIPEAWHEGGPYISAAIAVGLFLAFHRVRDWIERYIERMFFSSWHRAEAALKRFVESAGHFDRMPKLCSSFVEALSSYAQGAETVLYLRDRDGAYRLHAGKLAGTRKAYVDDPTFALMRCERMPIDLSQVDGAVPGALALPMLDQGALIGFVLLAGKPDGAQYRPDEVENLGWAAQQVGLDLRALHARQLEEQVAALTTQSAEKDRLLVLLASGRNA